jgi:glycosyltransferase involved in cell wall biosynthesis
VVAVDEGGPSSLIADGETGLLRHPDPGALADAVLALAESPLLRERIARGALAAIGERTWERSLARLAEGYRAVIEGRRARSVTPEQTRFIA